MRNCPLGRGSGRGQRVTTTAVASRVPPTRFLRRAAVRGAQASLDLCALTEARETAGLQVATDADKATFNRVRCQSPFIRGFCSAREVGAAH